jgi:mono/diheme cytochrome c family protein
MMRPALCLLACVMLAGCTRSNMDSQPKYHQYEPARLFRDGKVLQAPVVGTVARGDLDRAQETRQKPALTAELLAHGREQYDVFCAPCHDRVGTGDGIVVQRGFPRATSLHADSQRALSDQHLFDVIGDGFGAMFAHRDRIRPHDRWAIVAYVRALQMSQHATVTDVPAEARSLLEQTP